MSTNPPKFILPKFERTSFLFTGTLKGKIEELERQPFISIAPQSVLYRQIRSKLNLLLENPQNSEKFPGNLPVSLMRSDIPKLSNTENTYAVIEKTDGIRYLLFFTRYKSQPVATLLDRAFNCYLVVDLLCFEELYKGTILDVEYLIDRKTGKHTFWIFDTIASFGKSHMGKSNRHYIDRLHTAKTIVQEFIFQEISPMIGIQFFVKEPYPIWELQKFVEKILPKKKLDTPIDGLIFVCLENAYRSGQDFETFKWKRENDHTAEFLLRFPHSAPHTLPNPDPLSYSSTHIPVELWVDNTPHQKLIFYTKTSINVSLLAQYECKHLLDLDQKIVECRLISGRWVIEKIRKDKKTPNHLITIQKTEENIRENIQIQELFCQCSTCLKKQDSNQDQQTHCR